jgi:hypothetical protein
MYSIAKGTNKTVEFKGLSAQYLYMFAGGVVMSVFLFLILHFFGIPSLINLMFVGGGLFVFVYYIFTTNKKYGKYGVMQREARRAIAKNIKGSILLKIRIKQYFLKTSFLFGK